nr:hypothetical protein BaRGS_016353 [Batillaria attramentaria]
MLEEYKDANPNFTIRRREEQAREENQQIEMLRQKDLCTVDDVVESLRMTRITTAVVRLDAFPRLTRSDYCAANLCIIIIMATVFTLAEQICLAPDIMDERGVHRVAITVAALVAIGTNPRQSAV